MAGNAVKKTPQYSDLPDGANIVHDPGVATTSSYSDLPQGASVVPDAPAQPGFFRGVLSRMGSAVKSIPSALNPMETDADRAQGIPSLDPSGSGMPVPIAGPLTQPLMRWGTGQVAAEKQLGPQFVDQAKGAIQSHEYDPKASILQNMWKAGPSLEDARVATTGLSMLNPFASGSVANVNALHDSNQGDKALQQGVGDAAMLGSSFAVPPIARGVTNASGKLASTANVLAKPALNMGIEAAQDIPIVRGLMKGAKTFKDVPSQLNDIWKTSSPVQDALENGAPSAKLHNIPDFSVQHSPSAPVNLLDKPPTAPTGFQGEFDVNAPSSTPVQSTSPVPPRGILSQLDDFTRSSVMKKIQDRAAQGDWVAQGILKDQATAAAREAIPATTPYRPQGSGFGFSAARESARPGAPPPAGFNPDVANNPTFTMNTEPKPALEIVRPTDRPLNLTDSGNVQRSNLSKNIRQMGWDKAAQEPGIIAKATSTNSPVQAQASLDQAAQQLFGKSYNELSLEEKMKTLSPGAVNQR